MIHLFDDQYLVVKKSLVFTVSPVSAYSNLRRRRQTADCFITARNFEYLVVFFYVAKNNFSSRLYLKSKEEKDKERKSSRVCTVKLCKNEHCGYVRVGLDIKERKKTVETFVRFWAIFFSFATVVSDYTNQLVYILLRLSSIVATPLYYHRSVRRDVLCIRLPSNQTRNFLLMYFLKSMHKLCNVTR